MKNKMSVQQMALQDIAEENKIYREKEVQHYYDHKYLYTIGKLDIVRTNSRYESYIVPTHMLDNAETRALNRELGIHTMNMGKV